MTRYEEWSGETWFLRSDHTSPSRSISVIEPVPTAKKGKKSAKSKKVPFGFAREIPKKKRKR
jgi:hypothetical protein